MRLVNRIEEIFILPIDYWTVLRKAEKLLTNLKIHNYLIISMGFECISRGGLKLFGKYEETLSRKQKLEISRLFSRAWGYLALCFYDDGIDQFKLTEAEIIEHYVACLIALGIGLWHGFPVKRREMLTLKNALLPIFAEIFESLSNRDEIAENLWKDSLHARFSQDAEVSSLTDMFEKSKRLHPASVHLNVGIVGAFYFGKTLKDIKSLLGNSILSIAHIQDYESNVLKLLLNVCVAQAQTAKQTRIDAIDWISYVEIACRKSTYYLDCFASVRFPLQPEQLSKRRFQKIRFCEQFYLDDIADFFSDTYDGILGVLHVRLLTQGRVARQMLPYLNTSPLETLSYLKSTTLEEQAWSIKYKDIFLNQNPYYSDFFTNDEELSVMEDIEGRIYYLMANRRKDFLQPIEVLLREAVERYNAFSTAWDTRDHQSCIKLVLKAGIANYMIDSFLYYLKNNRTNWMEAYSFNIYIYFHLRMYWLKLKIKIYQLFSNWWSGEIITNP